MFNLNDNLTILNIQNNIYINLVLGRNTYLQRSCNLINFIQI